jgi:hypothetical protein
MMIVLLIGILAYAVMSLEKPQGPEDRKLLQADTSPSLGADKLELDVGTLADRLRRLVGSYAVSAAKSAEHHARNRAYQSAAETLHKSVPELVMEMELHPRQWGCIRDMLLRSVRVYRFPDGRHESEVDCGAILQIATYLNGLYLVSVAGATRG